MNNSTNTLAPSKAEQIAVIITEFLFENPLSNLSETMTLLQTSFLENTAPDEFDPTGTSNVLFTSNGVIKFVAKLQEVVNG